MTTAVHYAPGSLADPSCGVATSTDSYRGTAQIAKVTCKSCLRRLDLFSKPDLSASPAWAGGTRVGDYIAVFAPLPELDGRVHGEVIELNEAGIRIQPNRNPMQAPMWFPAHGVTALMVAVPPRG